MKNEEVIELWPMILLLHSGLPPSAFPLIPRPPVGRRRRRFVIVIVIINLAVVRVYRIATSKLFLKPAANRLEDPGGPMDDLLTEMHNSGTKSIRTFTNRSSRLLARILVGRIILLILGLLLPVVSWRTAIWATATGSRWPG